MQPVWDYIVSNSWLSITLIIFLMFMVTLAWYIRPFRNRVYNRILGTVLSLGSLALTFYLLMGYHGYAVHFNHALSNGNQLCLTERHWHGTGDGGSDERNRLYVLDVNTGECIYRKGMWYEEILLVRKNGVVFFEQTRTAEYSLEDGDELKEWSKERGFENYPQLSGGIQNINRQSRWWKSENSAYLTITALNGRKYCLDLTTDSLFESEYLPDRDRNATYKYDEYGVYYQPAGEYHRVEYKFKKTTGEINQLIRDEYLKEPIIYQQGKFLKPRVIALFDDKQFFVVKHNATLDNKNAILTAINFDLTKKWEVKQSELNAVDGYNENPELGTWHKVNGNLIVTFGGFVVYLSGDNGKVIWTTRL